MEELILKEREIRAKLVELINTSNLPAFIIKPVLKDMIEQLNNIEEAQYNQAKAIKEEKSMKEETQNGQD